MKIDHMSVSRHGVWIVCEQQYKFKYHLKVIPDKEEPFYFIYGNIIHKIAQEYVLEKAVRPITEVSTDVLHGKIEYKEGKKAPRLPKDYTERLPIHLRSIEKITNKIGFAGETEFPFEHDLDPPNKRMVKGVIDRIIRKDNKFWILDYKTTKKSKWRKGANEITGDLQLRTYAKILQHKFGVKPENIYCALYYLEDSELIGAKFSQQSLDDAENTLLRAYLDIENTNPDNVVGNVGEHCRRCDFNNICPFYKD